MICQDAVTSICLFAARLDVGGLAERDGVEVAQDVMRKALQSLTSSGSIQSWHGLSVTPEKVRFAVFVSPAVGYEVEYETQSLKPENEAALEVFYS